MDDPSPPLIWPLPRQTIGTKEREIAFRLVDTAQPHLRLAVRGSGQSKREGKRKIVGIETGSYSTYETWKMCINDTRRGDTSRTSSNVPTIVTFSIPIHSRFESKNPWQLMN